MAKILITGGTGMIGQALTAMLLQKGHEIIILSRHPTAAKPIAGVCYARWDIDKNEIDEKALRSAEHIVHLAGAPVMDKRWTDDYKKTILESRRAGSALLAEKLQNSEHQVRSIVSASAIGYYGSDPSPRKEGFIETDPPADNFLGETCKVWEESIASVKPRLVILRFGIVLSNEGGAYAEFKKPIKFGIAAILGNGNQVVSWIHIDDLCRMIIDGLEKTGLSGVYNAVAPNPVTNEELVLATAKKMRGKLLYSIACPRLPDQTWLR